MYAHAAGSREYEGRIADAKFLSEVRLVEIVYALSPKNCKAYLISNLRQPTNQGVHSEDIPMREAVSLKRQLANGTAGSATTPRLLFWASQQ